MSKRTFGEMSSESHAAGLLANTTALLDSGLWSDLTISCGEKDWKVHRAVVCLQSQPLAAAISGDFKGSFPASSHLLRVHANGKQEAQTGVIKLDEHDPEIVGHMVRFMYSGDYQLSKAKAAEGAVSGAIATSPISTPTTKVDCSEPAKLLDDSDELLVHTSVWLLADEKDVPKLKELAKFKYEAALETGWNSTAFCSSLSMIFAGTPITDTSLWDVAVGYAGRKTKELMDRGEFVNLLKGNAEIGLAVLKAHMESTQEWLRPKHCSRCGPNNSRYIYKRLTSGLAVNYFCSLCDHTYN